MKDFLIFFGEKDNRLYFCIVLRNRAAASMSKDIGGFGRHFIYMSLR